MAASPHVLLHQGLEFSVLQPTRVGPTQTRVVPIKVVQKKKAFFGWLLNYTLTLHSEGSRIIRMNGGMLIKQRPPWTNPDVQSSGIKASYFFGTSMPTAFLVGPPKEPSGSISYPPILALRKSRISFHSSLRNDI